MKIKILVIDAHPNKDSLSFSLAESYMEGARSTGAQVKKLRIADLQFDPNLQYGYQKRTELEPDLLEAFEMIKWADHLVWVHPVWWSGLPAVSKGFIDRMFLPGFAYATVPGSLRLKPLLKGKTATIIATLDQPGWFYRLFSKSPSEHQLKNTMKTVGIKPVKTKYIGIVKDSSENQRQKWLKQVRGLGKSWK